MSSITNIIKIQYSINAKFAELDEDNKAIMLRIVHLTKNYTDIVSPMISIPLFISTTYLAHRSSTLLTYTNYDEYNKEMHHIGTSITDRILWPFYDLTSNANEVYTEEINYNKNLIIILISIGILVLIIVYVTMIVLTWIFVAKNHNAQIGRASCRERVYVLV